MMRRGLKPNLLQTMENTPGPRARRPVRQHRARQLLGGGRPDRHRDAGTSWSPRRASAPTWAPSGSSTSSAGSPAWAPDAAVVVATVRALKAHSGKYKRRRRPPAAPRTCSGRTRRTCGGRREPRQADREHPRARRLAGRSDQLDATDDHPSEVAAVREIAESMGVPGGGSDALRRRRPRRDRDRRGGRRGRRGAERFQLLYPRRRRCGRRSRPSPPRSTAPTAWTTPRGEPAARRLREDRLRQPPDLHREDAPVRLATTRTSRAPRPAGRLPVREVRAIGRCRLHLPDLRRHAHHARPGSDPPAAHIDLDENGETVGLF